MLYQQIKRTKHTTNQNQKLLKILIEKVDSIQKFMYERFEIRLEFNNGDIQESKLNQIHDELPLETIPKGT